MVRQLSKVAEDTPYNLHHKVYMHMMQIYKNTHNALVASTPKDDASSPAAYASQYPVVSLLDNQ